MFRCIICWYPAVLDDVVIGGCASGLCICLRCFLRETDQLKPMPAVLRRAYAGAANEAA